VSILCSLLCTYMYIHCENWQFTNKCLCLKDLRGNTALWYWTFDGKIHSTHKYVYVNMSVLIQLVWSSLVVQCQTKCHIYLKYNDKNIGGCAHCVIIVEPSQMPERQWFSRFMELWLNSRRLTFINTTSLETNNVTQVYLY